VEEVASIVVLGRNPVSTSQAKERPDVLTKCLTVSPTRRRLPTNAHPSQMVAIKLNLVKLSNTGLSSMAMAVPIPPTNHAVSHGQQLRQMHLTELTDRAAEGNDYRKPPQDIMQILG
jgi:hypothetical protein